MIKLFFFNNFLYKILFKVIITKSNFFTIFKRNKKIDIRKIKNITIVSIYGIGNVVLTIPLLKQIKNNIPDCKITYFYTNKIAIQIIPSDLIEKFIYINLNEKPNLKLLSNFYKYKSDIIFYTYPFSNTTIQEISLLIKSKFRIGYNNISTIYYSHFLKVNKDLPEWRLNLDLYKNFLPVNNSLNLNKPILYYSEYFSTIKKISEQLNEYIVIHPGAGAKEKQWPVCHFIDLINLIKKNIKIEVILVGGPEEIHLGKTIKKQCNFVFDFTGKLSIIETAQLISLAKIMISNDSGLMHIGGAVGVPQIAIFGPTPINKNIPLGDINKKILIQSDCEPCYINGQFKCRLDNKYSCLEEIKPDYVFNKFLHLYNLIREKNAYTQ